MSPEIIGSLITFAGVGVAGWFAFLSKKASHRSPDTVAGGYSQLVADLRTELDRLSVRVKHLEEERENNNQKINQLNKQLSWVLNIIGDDDRAEFQMKFQQAN